MNSLTHPRLSVVIPVYNEEEGLQALFDRLYPALDHVASQYSLPYELVFINDGSKDRSAAMLAMQYEKRPDVTRVVLFANNFGQHMAIMAGFEYARGEYIITLDADLQNPPEEIDALVEKLIAGHDYVGTIRADRRDSFFRKLSSRAMNRLRENITRITMTDQGCMLRGYSRRIVDLVRQCDENNTFIPALAYTFAANPIEITVKHEERFAGES
ncbi:MAG: glycosyltransferase, partial [Burkholderiaceae bacterium]|nr:glycosyltransferase [Burkholderiaceae bacterium]